MSAALAWLASKVPAWIWVALASVGLLFAAKFYIDHLRSQVKSAKAETAQVKADWNAEHVAMQKAIDIERARQAEVVTKTVTVYRDRIRIQKEQADVIEREVEKLIPAGACELPAGFRVLHDAAATGAVPDDPARAADAADPVEVVAAARTIAENYAAARANAEKLTALQSLLKGLSP